MDAAITINNLLLVLGTVVTVVGFMKAMDYLKEKVNTKHDKEQQIDENSESLEAYIKKNESTILELNKRVSDAHGYATKGLNGLEKSIMKNLKDDKEEYLEGIRKVEASILEMQAVYQQTVAIIDVKIENLTKQVEKHNSVVERTFILERDVAVLNQRETASEKRLRELEDDRK